MKSIIYFLGLSILLFSCTQNEEDEQVKTILSYETLGNLRTAPSLKCKTFSPAVALYMYGDSTIPMSTDTFSQKSFSVIDDSLIIDFGENEYNHLSFSHANDKNYVHFHNKEGMGGGIKKTILKKFELKIDTSKLIGHLDAKWQYYFEVNGKDYQGSLKINDDFKLVTK
jgi:hypothetical protein